MVSADYVLHSAILILLPYLMWHSRGPSELIHLLIIGCCNFNFFLYESIKFDKLKTMIFTVQLKGSHFTDYWDNDAEIYKRSKNTHSPDYIFQHFFNIMLVVCDTLWENINDDIVKLYFYYTKRKHVDYSALLPFFLCARRTTLCNRYLLFFPLVWRCVPPLNRVLIAELPGGPFSLWKAR